MARPLAVTFSGCASVSASRFEAEEPGAAIGSSLSRRLKSLAPRPLDGRMNAP